MKVLRISSISFPNDLVDSIVHTNLYAMQKGFAVMFTRKDILVYIGLNIAMGIVDLPDITDCWTKEPMLQSPWFSLVMSLK